MSSKLTKYERETIISFNEKEDVANTLSQISEKEDSCVSNDDNDKQTVRNHKGEVTFNWGNDNDDSPKSHSLDDIVIIPGKIIFFIDAGRAFYIEDKEITSNVCATLNNNYKTYLGKKPILRNHFNDMYAIETYRSEILESGEYYTRYITEYIHDGITTFNILNSFVKEIIYRYYNEDDIFLYTDNGRGMFDYVYPYEHPLPPRPEESKAFDDDGPVKSKKPEYKYYNDVIAYSAFEQRYVQVRLPLDGIEITEGKITFLISDGSSFYIEDDSINRNICPEDENPIIDKYKSFFGKKSILKNHCEDVGSGFEESWPYIGETHWLEHIQEYIHDGVTTFLITDEKVKHIKLAN